MKHLKTFTDQLQANLSKSLLEHHGIKVQINGAQEYVSHLMGGGLGKYQLFVDEDDFENARAILREVEVQSADSPAAKDFDATTPNYFRKSLFAAIGAMILLPVVFNIASLLNAKRFWEHSEKDAVATLKLAFLIAMQLPSIYFIYFGYQMITGMLDSLDSLGVEEF